MTDCGDGEADQLVKQSKGDQGEDAVVKTPISEEKNNAEQAASAREGQDDGEDEDGDEVVTLDEVADEEEQLQADADALLGGQDATVCTYPEGYKPRQPLYACRTCASVNGNRLAAICLGCSYACHDGHDLIELYSKRNIRCDCGNQKLPNNKCNLFEDKKPLNEQNCYNQNYSGVYCICHRPYPDLDDQVEDQMVQCIVCEDWYHTRHLAASGEVLKNVEGGEVVCKACVERLPFLLKYRSVTDGADTSPTPNLTKIESSAGSAADVSRTEESKKTKKQCVLPLPLSEKAELEAVPLFFKSGSWRRSLCRCSQCEDMYDRLSCSFLVDLEDTLEFYESQGRKGDDEEKDKLVSALTKVTDRGVAVEMIYGYNHLKEQLGGFLKQFADQGRVVKEEDVRSFFSDLQENDAKRPGLSAPPTDCHQ